MKIVLLTPPFAILKEGKGSIFSFKKYGNHVPLGLAHLASVAEEDGHEVEISDGAARELSIQEMVDEVLAQAPELVGISVTTASRQKGYMLAEALRPHFQGTIIMGGPHAIAFGQEVLTDCLALDAACYSEGEQPLRELLPALESGQGLDAIDGIWFRINGEIVGTGKVSLVKKLDDLPRPAYHKFDLSLYKALPKQAKRRPYLPYITSRGCTWKKCTFCFQAGKAGQMYRRLSPERVVEDLKHLIDRYGVREIIFCDDNFLVNEKWLFSFAGALEAQQIDVTWSCYGRVDTISRKMLERLKTVGLWNIFFGFETGDQSLLELIQKGITLEQSRQAARWCNELGITTRASFMLALPGSSPERDRKTIDFAKEIEPTFCQFHITYPECGTRLYELALQDGRLEEKKDFKARTTATYVPEGYANAEEVEQMAMEAYRKFYLRPSYFWKHLKNIKSLHDVKEYFVGGMFVFGLFLGAIEKTITKKFNAKTKKSAQ